MEKSRDFRRAATSTTTTTVISPINGLPRRRQRFASFNEEYNNSNQMKLMEKTKDRDRKIPKKRRFEKSGFQQQQRISSEGFRDITTTNTDSSEDDDEEYYEEELEAEKTFQRNRTDRRGLRTLRSAPVFKSVADEVIGVPVPRRARSASAKRLHESYRNSGSEENFNRRRFSPLTASLTGSGSTSPSCSGASVKKNKQTKSERQARTRISSSSSTQNDIEFEVAEALFDLMKQSQSSNNIKIRENVGRESAFTPAVADDEVIKRRRLKGVEGGSKDEETNINSDFSSVQNEKSSVEKEKLILADSADKEEEVVVNNNNNKSKGKVVVGTPIQIESPSCDADIIIQNPRYGATVGEATRKKEEAKFVIDLMASPPMPSSPERDAPVDRSAIDPKIMVRDVGKSSGSVAIPLREDKIGASYFNQQQRVLKEQNNQAPTSFPIGMNGWPTVFPYQGYIPPRPQAVLPVVDGNARPTSVIQLPRFTFSQPRPKRCANHHYIAQNIHNHQENIKKSLFSEQIRTPTVQETKPLNLKSLPTKQSFTPGNYLPGDIRNLTTISSGNQKDKNSNVATDFSTNYNLVAQQAPNQAPNSNLLQHAPGFIFPFGQPQTTVTGNTSLASSSAGRPSMSFNQPMFNSNEAASYMAMLQNNGCPFPLSTNIPLSSMKGSESPAMPFFNPSFYSSRAFNASQNMSTSHKQPKLGENKYPTSAATPLQQPEKPQTEVTRKNGGSSNNGSGHAFPVQPMNFSIIPPGNNHSDTQQQGSKGRVDQNPQPFALSFSSNASNPPSLNFSPMNQNSALFHNYMLAQQKNFQKSGGSVAASNFQPSEQQLNQVRKHIVEQKQEASKSNNGPGSFVYSQGPFQMGSSSFPLPKSSQNQTQITFGNSSSVPASTPSQGQQTVFNGQPSKNTGVTFRTGPLTISKASSTNSALPTQETETSLNGSSQKKSPACRRNVPSILNTCPSQQLPELKY